VSRRHKCATVGAPDTFFAYVPAKVGDGSYSIGDAIKDKKEKLLN
jgi:hypothetical protein